jgi:hypothetical protein
MGFLEWLDLDLLDMTEESRRILHDLEHPI